MWLAGEFFGDQPLHVADDKLPSGTSPAAGGFVKAFMKGQRDVERYADALGFS